MCQPKMVTSRAHRTPTLALTLNPAPLWATSLSRETVLRFDCVRAAVSTVSGSLHSPLSLSLINTDTKVNTISN